MPPQALPGFRDFYPEDFALRAHIFDIWRKIATRYGFEEYDGPPLEPLELYTAKSGDEIVGQLYHFVDKGDRQVALRPEMTPTLARMVAARAGGLKKPIRWFSIPQLYRYERQQRGRLREHFQLNCDLIGEPGPLADAEIIALAIDVMRECGFHEKDFRVRLSDRALLMSLLASRTGVPEEWRPLQLAAIDRLEKSGKEKTAEWILKESDARLSADQIQKTLEIGGIRSIEEVRRAAAGLAEAEKGLTALEEALAALRSMGLGAYIDIDVGIVRGLAYYTGTVFELFDVGKTLRALCGGGRYDKLAGALGGVDLPAVGFGFGDVVLAELLKERGLAPKAHASIDVFIAAISAEDIPHMLGLAHQLRGAGFRTEYTLGAQAIGKQVKLADARNARAVIVIGPDDRARGEVALKDMKQNTQRAVPRADVVRHLKELLPIAD